MLKLNLGCGSTEYLDGWINIDRSPVVKSDRLLDITKGLPYLDNEADEIHCGCVLEQLTPEELLIVLNECHRVLQDGGKLHGYVPSTDPRVLHLDPMDKMFFQIESFNYFDKDAVHWQRFGKSYGFLPWTKIEATTNPAGIIYFCMQPYKG